MTTSKVSAKGRPASGRLPLRAYIGWFALVFGFVSTVSVSRLWATSSDALENEVKAAMVFNFTKFIEWPTASFTDSKAPFVVGLLGEDDLTPFLEAAMREKSVAGHPVRCIRMQAHKASENCHLLVIARSERRKGAEILSKWQRSGVLSVSTIDEFVKMGGVIGIVVEDKRARFEVNIDTARRANLNISSKLLRLARNFEDHIGGLR